MSVLDAAIQVLKEADKPLHAKEITERILSKGLWKTSGKTPAATVSARLYSDINTDFRGTFPYNNSVPAFAEQAL